MILKKKQKKRVRQLLPDSMKTPKTLLTILK